MFNKVFPFSILFLSCTSTPTWLSNFMQGICRSGTLSAQRYMFIFRLFRSIFLKVYLFY